MQCSVLTNGRCIHLIICVLGVWLNDRAIEIDWMIERVIQFWGSMLFQYLRPYSWWQNFSYTRLPLGLLGRTMGCYIGTNFCRVHEGAVQFLTMRDIYHRSLEYWWDIHLGSYRYPGGAYWSYIVIGVYKPDRDLCCGYFEPDYMDSSITPTSDTHLWKKGKAHPWTLINFN